MKKILKISAIVLFIILLAVAYYYFFFAKPATPTAPPDQNSQNFFPFGQGGGQASTTVTATSTQASPLQAQSYLQKLRLITNEPTAGATFVENPTGVTIRYMEKATGHIIDVSTYSNDTAEISNTTIPKIHETYFTGGGASFLARYVDTDGNTIQTLYGKITATSTTGTQTSVSGALLAKNISSVAVSPSGKSIFYIPNPGLTSTGILALADGSNKKQIWNSAIESVLPQFFGENQIVLTTKPNVDVVGYSYIVDAKTATVKNSLGRFNDLSILPNPSGKSLLAYSSDGGGELFMYSITSATTTPMTPTTFPEKCVFDANNKNTLYCAVPKQTLTTNSLDNWYLGLESYSDDIWKYNLANNTASMIEGLQTDGGRAIDAFNLQLNSASSLLIFQSKTDGSLWSLNVSGN